MNITQKTNLIDNINIPNDIKKLNITELNSLASEIRDFLIQNVSKTGGHLASNLGVVELTLALHMTFTTPEDKIVWDVGHQSYVHKLLTGRKNFFSSLRQFGGIAGFPKVKESRHDCFNTGHSSTSISAALGLARGRDLNKNTNSVIAVIGDGALTGGMAFEALNDAGRSHNNLIVILNDNEMSIAKNVGGMSTYLSKLRTEPFYFKFKEDIELILKKIPAIGRSAAKAAERLKEAIKYSLVSGVVFEELGFKYLGPIDGHNITELCDVLNRAKNQKGPVFIHISTQKGKGYAQAEQFPHLFHGVSSFNIETGEAISSGGQSYSDIFGQKLFEIGEINKKVAAITAAMPSGTGLELFSKAFPDRFFDVGIAEQHSVTLAAGLATSGITPVFAVYSSFLQRAYDQVLHDVALQNLHVVFAIDRAGIVGEDGETHQGIYDISFLSHIPNMTIMAPCDYQEFRVMLDFAINHCSGPVAIRYPRGKGKESLSQNPINYIMKSKGTTLKSGTDVSICALGPMVETALEVASNLEALGISVEIINPRFIKPFDQNLIFGSASKTKRLVTIEDNVISGGFGSLILTEANKQGLDIKIKLFGYPDEVIPQGTRSQLIVKYNLDVDSLTNDIKKWIKG